MGENSPNLVTLSPTELLSSEVGSWLTMKSANTDLLIQLVAGEAVIKRGGFSAASNFCPNELVLLKTAMFMPR
jgi:hypothetical protein